MNTRNGVLIHIWGMTRQKNANTGAILWNVDKGETHGFLIYTYNVNQPEMTAFDATRITLLLSPDANSDTGDCYEINGKRYYSDGVKASWMIYAGSKLDHLEIPLKAAP